MADTPATPRSVRARRAGRRVGAVLVALLTLAVLVWAVGVDTLEAALSEVGAREAVLLGLAGLVPVVIWGAELGLVLDGIGASVEAGRAVALFAATGFLNNLTPLGELGGNVPSGLLIAGDRGISFERGLAAITGVNAINRVALVALGVTALAWHGHHLGDVSGGWSLAIAVGAWVALLGGLVASWVYRSALLQRLGPPVSAGVAALGRWLPVVEEPAPSAVEARMRGFVEALERLSADPRRVARALVLGTLGHLAVATTLWLALSSLGAAVPVHDAVLVIPLAKASGLSPTPGGTGSAAVLVAGLLVVLTGVDVGTATGAALLYRASAFWLPTVVGGSVTVWLLPWRSAG